MKTKFGSPFRFNWKILFKPKWNPHFQNKGLWTRRQTMSCKNLEPPNQNKLHVWVQKSSYDEARSLKFLDMFVTKSFSYRWSWSGVPRRLGCWPAGFFLLFLFLFLLLLLLTWDADGVDCETLSASLVSSFVSLDPVKHFILWRVLIWILLASLWTDVFVCVNSFKSFLDLIKLLGVQCAFSCNLAWRLFITNK